jgi:hypothetical protein
VKRTKTRPRRGRPGSREAILDAAEALVGEAGAAHLTLDGVAARAGASKGGVLYNFATKEAPVRGMPIATGAVPHGKAARGRRRCLCR